MENNQFQSIFKKGSTTYYYSSLFFPPDIRNEVFTLYAFVRTADNYVDELPQKEKEFREFEKNTYQAFAGVHVGNPIIDEFVALAKKKKFQHDWVEAFLNSMKQDLSQKTYQTFQDLEAYMYGSAEVIGLMMASIFDLPKESYPFAQAQGKGMQLINFIRDVKEDLDLGRVYLPQDDLKDCGVSRLPLQTEEEKKGFVACMRRQIRRYERIQAEAEKGYHFLPRMLRYPVRTASDMYLWTAKQIEKDPLIVFEKKVKPKKWKVMMRYVYNSVFG